MLFSHGYEVQSQALERLVKYRCLRSSDSSSSLIGPDFGLGTRHRLE